MIKTNVGAITIGRVLTRKHGAINIRVDRSSVLGNPFFMAKETDRDAVCDKYEEYFNREILTRAGMQAEIRRIHDLALAGNNINLQCWCHPKRCHAETIKKHIEDMLRAEGIEGDKP